MVDQISNWRVSQLTDGQAKEIIYRAFIEDELGATKHLALLSHHEYLGASISEFAPRTKRSLQNAFTSGLSSSNPRLNSRQQPALASTSIHSTRMVSDQPT